MIETHKPLILGVPEVGIEPTRGCPHGILSPARLPVPPLRHGCERITYWENRFLSRAYSSMPWSEIGFRMDPPVRCCAIPPVPSFPNLLQKLAWPLTILLPFSTLGTLISGFGAVAQMGERMTGSHEVRGSIPLSSTKEIKGLQKYEPFFFCPMGHSWDNLFQHHTTLYHQSSLAFL